MASISKNDISLIYYTANSLPLAFHSSTYRQLLKAAQGLPIIVVSQKPMAIEEPNLVVSLPRHHLSIYRQALLGAKEATTPYIALCEDDILYSPEHFKQCPSSDKFAYNMNYWNIATWGESMFTQKFGGRRNLGNLICSRQLFIDAMEERFAKHDDNVNLSIWAEPGKYERQLGVTVQETEIFTTNPPNIMFSHQTALSFENLGTRKRLGEIRADKIPYWGTAESIREMYQ